MVYVAWILGLLASQRRWKEGATIDEDGDDGHAEVADKLTHKS